MEATTGVGPLIGQSAAERRRVARRSIPVPANRTADWPHTTRPLPWVLFAFFAMLWLIPFDSIYLPFGGPVNATLDRPLLVVLAGIWFVSSSAIRKGHSVRNSPVHWAFGIFTAIAATSILVHGEALVRLGDMELAIKQLALLATYGIFFALAASIIRVTEISKLITAMLALACFTALAVIVEYRFKYNVYHDLIGPMFPGYVRPEGLGEIDSIGRRQIFGPGVHALVPAVMLSLALPFAFTWLLKAKERREKLIYLGVVVLLIGGAVATQKKTAMVGPLVCILVLLAYRPKAMLRLSPLVIVLIAVVHLTAPGALGGVIDQFSPNSVTKADTTTARVSDYDAVTPDLADHPLIGRGYGSYNQKVHRILDNLYLTLGIGVGLLGLLGYLAIFGTSFLNAHRVARSGDSDRAPPAIAAVAAICVALVAGALLDFLTFPQLPYLFCFIAAIAYVLGEDHLAQRRKRATPRPQTSVAR